VADQYFGHGAFYFLSLKFDVGANITLFRPHHHWPYSVWGFFFLYAANKNNSQELKVPSETKLTECKMNILFCVLKAEYPNVAGYFRSIMCLCRVYQLMIFNPGETNSRFIQDSFFSPSVAINSSSAENNIGVGCLVIVRVHYQ
jgi:hypothetical protein